MQKRILLAEDDHSIRVLVQRILHELGCSVEVYNNGRSALEAAKSDSGFGLVITDLIMPEMDGYNLIRELRATEEYKDVPIILLSGSPTRLIPEIVGFGAVEQVQKPFTLDELERTVLRLLNMKN
jgi:two-component system chemotaxis sensor kinase CheA